MKTWPKIVLWITGSILIVFIIGLISVYVWLSTKWTDFYTESEMQVMTKQISSTKALPDNFYVAYDRVFPNQRNRSLKKMSFQAIWYTLTMNDDKLMNYKQCNCIWTTNFFENKVPINYHSWTSLITAHGFEKYTSESKCLDYSYRKLGIDSLSNRYFTKPIQELTTKQNIELILRIENPILYVRRPELLEKELEKHE